MHIPSTFQFPSQVMPLSSASTQEDAELKCFFKSEKKSRGNDRKLGKHINCVAQMDKANDVRCKDLPRYFKFFVYE